MKKKDEDARLLVCRDARKRRKDLFKESRPNVRPFIPMENGDPSSDMGILWAAYRKGSFNLPEMTEKQFLDLMFQALSQYNFAWLIEDENEGFRSGRGPVGFVGAKFDGWKINPDFEWFAWSTKANKLRSAVAFLNIISQRKQIGVCVVSSLKNNIALFRTISSDYLPFFYFVGVIPNARPDGNEYLFSMRCKHGRNDGSRTQGVQRDSGRERPTSPSEERESPIPGTDLSSIGEGNSDLKRSAGGNGATGEVRP